ncbi:MAG: tetratricopeptide repeat protein [Methylococcaceae bacterium]|nr:tetratricopeptide repeat protein [Methylococcaceae bacterium]
MNFIRSRLLTALLAGFLATAQAAEKPFEAALQQIQDEWAEAFYHQPDDRQAEVYESLLPRVRKLAKAHPERAEPLIVEAVILCTYAAADWGLSSLTRLDQARELLIRSMDRDPKAMDASAYITLGNLYYRLPGWPISYGDENQAITYLEAAVRLYPDGLDSNYFLGDYWLHEGKYDKAIGYFEKADKAPLRANQRLSDEKIKQELQVALAASRKHLAPRADFFSSLLPDFNDGKSH